MSVCLIILIQFNVVWCFTPLLCLVLTFCGTGNLPATNRSEDCVSASNNAIRIEGRVIDALPAETDPDTLLYLLDCDGDQIIVSTKAGDKPRNQCENVIGAQMSVVGIIRTKMQDGQKLLDRMIQASPENIILLAPPPANPYSTRYGTSDLVSPSPSMDRPNGRQRVQGFVIASWPDNNMLIRTPTGEIIRINILNQRPPLCGEAIEVIGFPVSDILQVSLTRGICRPYTCISNEVPMAERIEARQLLFDNKGRHRVDARYHGRSVVFTGTATGFSSIRGFHSQFLIACGDIHIPIYLPKTEKPPFDPGSIVEIEGTCVVDMETKNPIGGIPRIRELLVSVPDANHVRTIRNPPWWTPARLLSAIAGLFLIICGFFIWNLSLKRMLSRRSKALEKEISARLESNLKTRERTRLAVELHDSISQNLSGMAMEIGTAVRVAQTGIENMMPHLNIASRTLQSCRDDLRDCLWDLRSNALEATDMNDAIVKTLCPYLKPDTALHVRFNVPRNTLSDNTAHTLLRIVRELVSNALRHGGATEIKIAGTIDGRQLLFSVQDNGCGFDPANSPGITQGHFGLQGIHERIQRFGGKMRIEQIQPTGAKITINMNISFPQEEDLATP